MYRACRMAKHWSVEDDAVRVYKDGVQRGDVVLICSLANSLNPDLNHTSYKHQRDSFKLYKMIKNVREMEDEMRMRYDAGDYDAMFNIGLWKYHNSMIAESEPFIRSAHENGHTRATSFLALCKSVGDYGGEDQAAATSLFEEAANKNHSFSMVHLAHRYIQGIGVKQDINKGISWYWRAASMGDVDGLLDMARMYKNGTYVPRNKRLSLCLFKQAADKNNHWALIHLGEQYRRRHDFVKAVEYYKTAADVASVSTHFVANVYLAECYIDGTGVPCDYGYAASLYIKALCEGFMSSVHPRYGRDWDVQHLLSDIIKRHPWSCLEGLSPMIASGSTYARTFLYSYGDAAVKCIIDDLDRVVLMKKARSVAERHHQLVEVDPNDPITVEVVFKMKLDLFQELVLYM